MNRQGRTAPPIERVDQSHNGVRVIVYRSAGGSTVEAACRVHSNPHCPTLLRRNREEAQ